MRDVSSASMRTPVRPSTRPEGDAAADRSAERGAADHRVGRRVERDRPDRRSRPLRGHPCDRVVLDVVDGDGGGDRGRAAAGGRAGQRLDARRVVGRQRERAGRVERRRAERQSLGGVRDAVERDRTAEREDRAAGHADRGCVHVGLRIGRDGDAAAAGKRGGVAHARTHGVLDQIAADGGAGGAPVGADRERDAAGDRDDLGRVGRTQLQARRRVGVGTVVEQGADAVRHAVERGRTGDRRVAAGREPGGGAADQPGAVGFDADLAGAGRHAGADDLRGRGVADVVDGGGGADRHVAGPGDGAGQTDDLGVVGRDDP
ncbi:MAG: hypothetical protein MUF30_10605 [Burkholderiales bacterium]|nr:hypothetical protein [Burkholderiales bacterium]